MKVELKQNGNGKGKELVVTLELDEKGYLSDTCKTFIHGTTHGNVSAGHVMPNGKPLMLGVTAFTNIPKAERAAIAEKHGRVYVPGDKG